MEPGPLSLVLYRYPVPPIIREPNHFRNVPHHHLIPILVPTLRSGTPGPLYQSGNDRYPSPRSPSNTTEPLTTVIEPDKVKTVPKRRKGRQQRVGRCQGDREDT